MKKPDSVILLFLLVLFIACDKKESSLEKPTADLSINFSGTLNENWINEDGWFVINRLYKLQDHDQLSITLAKGYANLSILYIAKEGHLLPGTYSLATEDKEVNSARAEYYVLGGDMNYKCRSGALTLTEINDNLVKGFINGRFCNTDGKHDLIVSGSFSIPPLY